MKKLINNPDRVVTEMLQGLCEAEPELVYAGEGIEVVSRREKTPGKVGLVSGGGSGHEPGYVKKGMLVGGGGMFLHTARPILEKNSLRRTANNRRSGAKLFGSLAASRWRQSWRRWRASGQNAWW